MRDTEFSISGKAFKSARLGTGMSRADFARAVGVSEPRQETIEKSDRTVVRHKVILGVSKALNKSIEETKTLLEASKDGPGTVRLRPVKLVPAPPHSDREGIPRINLLDRLGHTSGLLTPIFSKSDRVWEGGKRGKFLEFLVSLANGHLFFYYKATKPKITGSDNYGDLMDADSFAQECDPALAVEWFSRNAQDVPAEILDLAKSNPKAPMSFDAMLASIPGLKDAQAEKIEKALAARKTPKQVRKPAKS